MTDGYLKFDNQHVGNVIDKKKQITIRKGESFVEPGQEIDLLTASDNKFGEAIVMSVEETTAKDVVNKTFTHHKNYSGFMEFKDEMKEYYDEEIEPSTTFTVIWFRMKDE